MEGDGDIELERGRTLGRYVVLDPLGRGAMGSVHAAYDPELVRRVALKVLRPSAVARQGHEAARQRLLREAQALARLAHPNVVRVFDVGVDGGRVFLAMELVEGQSLRRWLEVPRDWREVAQVLEQAGRGLAAAHALGLVHRDFKPDNVLMAEDGRVRVGDFGLVRRIDAPEAETALHPSAESVGDGLLRTGAGEVLGTPAYMAPEQHAGEEAGPRSDQYAFCVTLFEALYGRRPFADDDARALIEAKLRGTGIEAGPQGAVGRVPAPLRALLRRGLSPTPADRFAAMEPLLDALARVRAGVGARRGAAAVGAVMLGALGVAWIGGGEPAAPCAGAGTGASTNWSEASREAVQRRVGQHLPEDEVARTLGGLDRWVQAWSEADRDACEDTWIRGEQSPARLAARTDCLQGQWAELEETVALLELADRHTAVHAAGLVGGLPGPESCTREPGRGRARAGDHARAEATRRSLARVAVLRRAERYDEAWAELEAWEEREDEGPTAAASARACARGMVLADQQAREQSQAAYREALQLARVAGDDGVEAEAWLGLARVEPNPERARFYDQMAAAVGAGDDRSERLPTNGGDGER